MSAGIGELNRKQGDKYEFCKFSNRTGKKLHNSLSDKKQPGNSRNGDKHGEGIDYLHRRRKRKGIIMALLCYILIYNFDGSVNLKPQPMIGNQVSIIGEQFKVDFTYYFVAKNMNLTFNKPVQNVSAEDCVYISDNNNNKAE
jgi:hypothetical protein